MLHPAAQFDARHAPIHRPIRVAIAVPLLMAGSAVLAHPPAWQIRGGRLFVDGEWTFLKIAKPLRDFGDPRGADQLRKDLGILQRKGYNCIEINCYWHQFDPDGDGELDKSVEPVNALIRAIVERGMFPCLSVETYGVGGGTVPVGFCKRHPDAAAVNAEGRRVIDSEYGFGTAVPSLFAPAYLEASRRYIRNLTRAVDHAKILHFETTVEPQYIGNQWIDYSRHARRAFEAWKKEKGLQKPEWPDAFPVPESFRTDAVWNRFRAEALANWVNGDAAIFREVAGADSYIAVDYLETCGGEMMRRNGDSIAFLGELSCANIVQVNWHWNLRDRRPNECAYRNIETVRRATGRDWAIAEHMTLNGSDYRPDEVAAMLENTLQRGTLYGWEFVNVAPGSWDAFALYNSDWSPKPLIEKVDGRWNNWLTKVRREAARRSQKSSDKRDGS